MTSDQAPGNQSTSSDVPERGNSGEGRDPSPTSPTTPAKGDATGTKEEKDARAFDHPGKSVDRD